MTLEEAKIKLSELSAYPVFALPRYFIDDLDIAKLTGREIVYHSDNGRSFSQDIHIAWNYDDGYMIWGDHPVSQISV